MKYESKRYAVVNQPTPESALYFDGSTIICVGRGLVHHEKIV